MSLAVRVSTSSFELFFGTRTFFTGFQVIAEKEMIAEIINRGSLICAALSPLVMLLGSLNASSFQKSNMTAG